MNMQSRTAVVVALAGSVCQAAITHSSSLTTTGAGIYCGDLTNHAETAWGRAFDLSDFGITGTFQVQSVLFGVGHASSSDDNQQTVTINVYDGYTDLGGSIVRGTLVGTTTGMVADGALFNLTWNVSATVTSGLMYVEVAVPSSQAPNPTTDLFRIGINNAPETGPTYLRGPSCGINNPLVLSNIGYPDDHMVLAIEGVPAPATAPVLGAFVLLGSRRRR